ncbi:MAG: DUF4177 domain-containing protein [Defluviitaleaceae bacterium]|nr:DUF4177 domain-containing protein [Defluviitaleaceae bacterium]
MQKWEYKYLELYVSFDRGLYFRELSTNEIIQIGDIKRYGKGLAKVVNKFGAEGWELINVVDGVVENVSEYIFKRPIIKDAKSVIKDTKQEKL